MAFHISLPQLLCLHSLLCFQYCYAKDVAEMSIEEYIDYINPPAVYNYTDNGVPILCVKFEDQISMRGENDQPEKAYKISYSGHGRRCPEGTVAMVETTYEHVKGAGSVADFVRINGAASVAPEGDPLSINKHSDIPPIQRNPDNTSAMFADLHSNCERFVRITTDLNVWQSYVADDTIASVTRIQIFGDDRRDNILVGYEINPTRYNGDRRPRILVGWRSSVASGCDNFYCEGFVGVKNSGNYFPGNVIGPVSVFDGPQYHISVELRKASGRSWLLYIQNELAGYWPLELFGSFETASRADIGGLVVWRGTTGGPTTSDIGSGVPPGAGPRKTTFAKKINIYEDYNGNLAGPKMFILSSNPKCYNAVKVYSYEKRVEWAQHVYFGGPGADDEDCH